MVKPTGLYFKGWPNVHKYRLFDRLSALYDFFKVINIHCLYCESYHPTFHCTRPRYAAPELCSGYSLDNRNDTGDIKLLHKQ